MSFPVTACLLKDGKVSATRICLLPDSALEVDFETLVSRLASQFASEGVTATQLRRDFCIQVPRCCRSSAASLSGGFPQYSSLLQVPGNSSSLCDSVAASDLYSLLKAEARLSFGLPKSFEGPPGDVILGRLRRLDCAVKPSLLSGNCGPDWRPARYGSCQGQLRLVVHPASKHQLSLAGCGQLTLEPFFQDDGSSLTLHDITHHLMAALTVSEGIPDYICFQTLNLQVSPMASEHPTWLQDATMDNYKLTSASGGVSRPMLVPIRPGPRSHSDSNAAISATSTGIPS